MSSSAVPIPFWEQHCCLPLDVTARVDDVLRYRRPHGSVVTVNVGYRPQSRADATALATTFAARARALGSIVLDDAPDPTPDGGIRLRFDLEDAAPLEGDLDNVAHFRALGVTTLLPSYNTANAAGCGCLDTTDTGLTAYGRALVATMNAVGMTVDGSHCSVRTGLDLSEATTAPMVYSHSNLLRLHDHPRNITDDQARACAATGGVVGINGVGIFLGANAPDERAARLERMADQIEAAVDLLGIDHVGIGSDFSFDAAEFQQEMAADPSTYPESYTRWGPLQWVPPEDVLTLDRVLARRGVDDAAVRKVFHDNFARVAREVAAARR